MLLLPSRNLIEPRCPECGRLRAPRFTPRIPRRSLPRWRRNSDVLNGGILTKNGGIVTANGGVVVKTASSDCGCCVPNYRRAHKCGTGDFVDLWMLDTDAAGYTGVFKVSGGDYCYYFDFGELTSTSPGTVKTPSDVTNTYSACTNAACKSCGCFGTTHSTITVTLAGIAYPVGCETCTQPFLRVDGAKGTGNPNGTFTLTTIGTCDWTFTGSNTDFAMSTYIPSSGCTGTPNASRSGWNQIRVKIVSGTVTLTAQTSGAAEIFTGTGTIPTDCATPLVITNTSTNALQICSGTADEHSYLTGGTGTITF